MAADADAEMDADQGLSALGNGGLYGRAADGHEGFVGQVQGNGAQVVFAGFLDD